MLGDSGAPVTHLMDALPAETLDDLKGSSPTARCSASPRFRTTEDEAVVAISDGVAGEYIVQVRGYNGASSVPALHAARRERGAAAGAGLPVVVPGALLPPATGPPANLAPIPADTDTLFLANGPQLAAYGRPERP